MSVEEQTRSTSFRADACGGVRSSRPVPKRRHLVTHEGHPRSPHLLERDRAAVEVGAELLPQVSLTGTPTELRDRVAGLRDAGVTEIAYQPAGRDIPGELERFIAAIG